MIELLSCMIRWLRVLLVEVYFYMARYTVNICPCTQLIVGSNCLSNQCHWLHRHKIEGVALPFSQHFSCKGLFRCKDGVNNKQSHAGQSLYLPDYDIWGYGPLLWSLEWFSSHTGQKQQQPDSVAHAGMKLLDTVLCSRWTSQTSPGIIDLSRSLPSR